MIDILEKDYFRQNGTIVKGICSLVLIDEESRTYMFDIENRGLPEKFFKYSFVDDPNLEKRDEINAEIERLKQELEEL